MPRSVSFCLAVVVLALCPLRGAPRIELAAEGDGRYEWNSGAGHTLSLYALAGSVRATFADRMGDRLILFVLGEAANTFSSFMLHQLWVRLKGPMGVWNVDVGRVGIPWGLLTSLSTDRLLYNGASERVLGVEADNGVLVSGVAGRFDYGVALTQGYGHHTLLPPSFPGPLIGTARLGMVMGGMDEVSIGLSGAYGRTRGGHHDADEQHRALAALDLSFFAGPATLRGELSAGAIEHQGAGGVFAALDYLLHRRLELTIAALHTVAARHGRSELFGGLSFIHPWAVVRGGYGYEYHHEQGYHRVVVQLFRQFARTFQ